MALINNTTTTYAVGTAGGNREDLEDVIWDLEPLETYCLTSFDKVKATATFHEWPKDALVAPASNIGLEGDDFVAGDHASDPRGQLLPDLPQAVPRLRHARSGEIRWPRFRRGAPAQEADDGIEERHRVRHRA
jgi:hypothetical protein